MSVGSSDTRRVLKAFESARKATTQDEYDEAIADLAALAKENVALAVWASMAKIQIERPALIPTTLIVCATSIVLAIGRLFSAG